MSHCGYFGGPECFHLSLCGCLALLVRCCHSQHIVCCSGCRVSGPTNSFMNRRWYRALCLMPHRPRRSTSPSPAFWAQRSLALPCGTLLLWALDWGCRRSARASFLMYVNGGVRMWSLVFLNVTNTHSRMHRLQPSVDMTACPVPLPPVRYKISSSSLACFVLPLRHALTHTRALICRRRLRINSTSAMGSQTVPLVANSSWRARSR